MTDDQQKTQQPDAPASVTAPAGSREDGASEGANTNFGPVLTEVPHEQETPAEQVQEDGHK